MTINLLKETNKVVENEGKIRSGNSKLRTHLRKGYWRIQWHGPRDKPEERTMDLIFIPPCIVRGFNENVDLG